MSMKLENQRQGKYFRSHKKRRQIPDKQTDNQFLNNSLKTPEDRGIIN